MWVFRKELEEKRLMERLFARFDECLRELDVELRVRSDYRCNLCSGTQTTQYEVRKQLITASEIISA
ncbi:hypothetical protein [Nitrosomonas mobilis]|uniref:hypothetical protein n=1 Tax=Nitrosomonas mobilis TaxID=51642 RepID=UPI000B7C6653|nr:hypothetical protein [Nitrosomonas mobilis]